MTASQTVLVMAGAREAHGIVKGLLNRGRSVLASLQEPERAFDPLPVKTRIGPFVDTRELRTWCSREGITRIIDAGHAFDDAVSKMAFGAARAADLPYLRVLRAPWVASAQDRWILVASVREAVAAMGEGARVFSNTGWASLPDYADFAGEVVYMRQTHTVSHPAPYAFVRFIEGQPPFSQQSEEKLFRELRISRLVCRNVGGAASKSKLLAARKLGISVVMVSRPDPPAGAAIADSVPEALAWEANL